MVGRFKGQDQNMKIKSYLACLLIKTLLPCYKCVHLCLIWSNCDFVASTWVIQNLINWQVIVIWVSMIFRSYVWNMWPINLNSIGDIDGTYNWKISVHRFDTYESMTKKYWFVNIISMTEKSKISNLRNNILFKKQRQHVYFFFFRPRPKNIQK